MPFELPQRGKELKETDIILRRAGRLEGSLKEPMKSIRLTVHAIQQCAERGASENEVREAIERGAREPAKRGRLMYRLNFEYRARWQGEYYAVKQVAPVVVEAENEIVVVTVYTFYF